MTPKEKAEELVEKYYALIDFSEMYQPSSKSAKECALICVDEIIRVIKQIQFNKDVFLEDTEISYWWEIRQEINKL